MTSSPSEAIQTAYERDGFYIHAESVLPPQALALAAEGLEAVRAGTSDTGETPDSGWSHKADPLALTKIEQPQLASNALRAALASKRLGEVAAAATGAQTVQVWWVQGLVKPGAQGLPAATTVGWHQDKTYWSDWEEDSELFTAWLALSDVTPDAGPMVFVPGSHQWGLLKGGDFFAQDQQSLRAGIAIPEGEEWREVLDVLPPGGVSLHHRLLFHGSHPNVLPRPRRSLAIHLRTENSRPRSGSWVERYLDRPEICPTIFG